MKKIRLDWSKVEPLIVNALSEDLGAVDLTTELVFPEDRSCKAVFVAKSDGILAGLPVAKRIYNKLNNKISWLEKKTEGQKIDHGDIIVDIEGSIKAILSGERLALNFIQRISAIATITSEFVEAVKGLSVKIVDTRKTAPGLRILDKYAVTIGGGYNHRFGLFDGILIKDNHIKAKGSISNAVQAVREGLRDNLQIEVEASTLEQVKEAISNNVDIIMLDNMSPDLIRKAVLLIKGRTLIEASGGITLEKVREIAEAGVDFISIGSLTHSCHALDIGLYMVKYVNHNI